MHCGLLGNHLSHSYSPLIHNYLGDYPYVLFDKTPDELDDFLRNGEFTGINITAPYKKAVIPYCALLTDTAKRLGAVNTIIRRADGSLSGHNTDYFGFSFMLRRSGLITTGKKVLVLGNGGAAAAVCGVLKDVGAKAVVISRSGVNNYQNLYLHSDASIIVNATPVGMYPNTGDSPISLEYFPKLEGVLDIIYNPARTQLLMDAEKLGVKTMNGLWMLIAQAKEASEWFTARHITDDTIERIYNKLSSKLMNIVLIGMPGSGKTTIGQILAHLTGRKFIDSDEYISKMTNKSIESILLEDGEEHFRYLETEVLQEFGKQSGLVISTGGGCVTKHRNYPLLHQNSKIIWLQRNLQDLPKAGRPLSQANDLSVMYASREPYYQAFTDQIVRNDSTPEEAAIQIVTTEDLDENSCA